MRQVVMLKNLLGSCEVKLPGAEFATVDIGKLREYCLNPNHLGGGTSAVSSLPR
jgi:hypothetical protein